MWLTWLVLLLSPIKILSDRQSPEIQCLNNTYPPTTYGQVPIYVIDLDLPPEQRWQQIGQDQKVNLQILLDNIKNLTKAFFGDTVMHLVDIGMPHLLATLSEPYRSEIQGLANATGIPVGEVTLYNVFYEFFTVCTSLLVRDDTNNLVLHGRNLDFGLFLGWDPHNHTWAITEALRPTVIQLDFRKQNQTVFQAAGFAGYVGVLTGLKNGRFSLTIDERFNANGGYWGLLEWILGRRDQSWLGFVMRDVLENSANFAEAQKTLITTKLLAPAYFILAGNQSDQACVLTKDRNSNTSDVWTMQDASSWFLVETNYDHWKEPPFFDDRRTPAQNCLKQKTQSVASTFPGLFDVLSSKPNLNQLTVYTCLMNARAGIMETYLQKCEGSCSPW